MATKTKKAPTLASLEAIKNPTPAQLAEIQSLKLEQTLGSYGAVGAAGGSTTVPGVTSTEANDVVPFTLPDQKAAFTPTAGLTTAGTAGGTAMSYSDWVEEIHKLVGDKATLETIQTALHGAGYLTKSWANYGTLDTATITAWKALGTAAIDSDVSASSLIAGGLAGQNVVADLQAVQLKKNTAIEQAAAVTNSNVSLTDPNELAQHFATAMESMGEGAPSQAKVNAFVSAFHDSEVNASMNEATAEKQNYIAGAGDLSKTEADLKAGNLDAAQAAEATVGPVSVATKAAPNIDAEAIAQAQANNPAEYYANDMTYGYSLLQKMLGGDMSLPASPSSPTSLTPSGAVVTSPLVGATG
jgi:hypothetical protein